MFYICSFKAEEGEMYTLQELMDDLGHCSAYNVHVIVDQSYAGNVADAFRNSYPHKNVIVFASGRDHEYSFDGEFTRHWVTANHTNTCSWHVHKVCID